MKFTQTHRKRIFVIHQNTNPKKTKTSRSDPHPLTHKKKTDFLATTPLSQPHHYEARSYHTKSFLHPRFEQCPLNIKKKTATHHHESPNRRSPRFLIAINSTNVSQSEPKIQNISIQPPHQKFAQPGKDKHCVNKPIA